MTLDQNTALHAIQLAIDDARAADKEKGYTRGPSATVVRLEYLKRHIARGGQITITESPSLAEQVF